MPLAEAVGDSMSEAPLVALLKDAFGEVTPFPEGCWVKKVILRNYSRWPRAIEVVGEFPHERAVLMQRLRLEHPLRKAHTEQHDAGLRRVFIELEAFAWAKEIAELGSLDSLPRRGGLLTW